MFDRANHVNDNHENLLNEVSVANSNDQPVEVSPEEAEKLAFSDKALNIMFFKKK